MMKIFAFVRIVRVSLADTGLPKRKVGRLGHLRDVPVKGKTAKLVLPLAEADSTDDKNDRTGIFQQRRMKHPQLV
ncbi:hypothetical protein MRX96_020615 [Rhipicephalus microplus]